MSYRYVMVIKEEKASLNMFCYAFYYIIIFFKKNVRFSNVSLSVRPAILTKVLSPSPLIFHFIIFGLLFKFINVYWKKVLLISVL